jgi:predicted transcriptional regulator
MTPTQKKRILAARGKLTLMIRSAHLVELRALADADLVVFEGELVYRLTDAGEVMAQALAASNDQS